MDTSYWNDFAFRGDDIIISTWQTAGTTQAQQIVAQFIFEGEAESLPIGDMSSWLISACRHWRKSCPASRRRPIGAF